MDTGTPDSPGGGYGDTLGSVAGLGAALGSVVNPRLAPLALQFQQMAALGEYRDRQAQERAAERAREAAGQRAFADYLAQQGITVSPDIPISGQAQIGTFQAGQQRQAREDAQKTRDRDVYGQIADVSAQLPDVPPDETIEKVRRIAARGVTKEQRDDLGAIQKGAADLRGRLVQASNFEAPFREAVSVPLGTPALPEPPGPPPFALGGAEASDDAPLARAIREELPTGMPALPSVDYTRVPPNVMRASEQIVRSEKPPEAQDLITRFGLDPRQVPGGAKIASDERTAALQQEKTQLEVDAAKRKAAGIPEGPASDIGKLHQDVLWLKSMGEGDDSPAVRAVREKIAKVERGEAQSPVGKLQEDIVRARRLYGDRSPQVAALAAAIQKETTPEGVLVKPSDYHAIRGEFAKQSSDFITIRSSYDNAKAQATNDSAAADVALIYSFMKMQDPGSVVREGEYATAQNAAGVADRARNVYNRLLTGERLTPQQRASFVKEAETIFDNRLRQQSQLEGSYAGIAQRQGMDARNVVVDFMGPHRPRLTAPPPAPKETLSRDDPRYTAARQRGLTDAQIEQQFGVKVLGGR